MKRYLHQSFTVFALVLLCTAQIEAYPYPHTNKPSFAHVVDHYDTITEGDAVQNHVLFNRTQTVTAPFRIVPKSSLKVVVNHLARPPNNGRKVGVNTIYNV